MKKKQKKAAPRNSVEGFFKRAHETAQKLDEGEATEPNEDGTLPKTATHVIIKKPDGTVEFKRNKFKLR